MIAKLQSDGTPTGLDKQSWWLAIERRAEQRYGETTPSPQQKFTKCICDDRIGRELYAAYKAAPNPVLPAPVPGPKPDVHASLAKRSGPASEKMLKLARAHNAAHPDRSPEQSYAAVYTSRDNVDLKQQLAGENLELWQGDSTMAGDTRYTALQSAPYRNPHRP